MFIVFMQKLEMRGKSQRYSICGGSYWAASERPLFGFCGPHTG